MKCGETGWPLRLEGEIRCNDLLRLYPNTSATQQCERGDNSGEYSALVGFAVTREKKKNGRVETGEGTIIGTRAPTNKIQERLQVMQ